MKFFTTLFSFFFFTTLFSQEMTNISPLEIPGISSEMIKEKNYRLEKYNLGETELKKGNYQSADSLFTLAINAGDRNKDTYFNRAIAKKKMKDACGFCINLALAAELGDAEANSIFWKNCPKADSIFDCEKNTRVSIKDTQTRIVRLKPISKAKSISVLYPSEGLTHQYFIDSAGKTDTLNIKDQVYDLVAIQVQPEFPGGDKALMNFLRQNISYPIKERDHGIQGKVYVTFVIDKDGSVTDIGLYKGLQNGPGCDAEAIRVIKLLPKWKPGKQNGRLVKVRYILPVKYQLQ